MRNRSLDLLKMISMLLVIGLHFLYYGGFLEQYNTIKTNVLGYCFTWILEALCYFSVDVFILITGYFMCESQMKTTRLFSLAKQVWVYSIIGLLIGIIVKCAFPDIDVQISKLSLLHTFTPIISGDYWFITSYFLLMLCVPFLNGVINNIDIDRFQKILFAGIIIFSIVPSFLPWCDTNIFNNGGASPVWFCILYLSGAYIRKSGIKVKTSFLSSALIVIITIIFSSKLIIQICCSEILHKSVGGAYFITIIAFLCI